MDAKTGANTKTGKLTLGDKNYSFPLLEGTLGPEVMDVSKLYNQAEIFTYDPGFTSTASCESKITYIDGDKGVLLYRGYQIEDLEEAAQAPHRRLALAPRRSPRAHPPPTRDVGAAHDRRRD